jgi:hypothetical protein
MMERKGGVFDWSHTYSSPLEMNKLALVNFSHLQLKTVEAGKLILFQTTPRGTTKHEPPGKPQAKLLGIILDSKLNWSTQHKKVREKAMKFTAAFKRYTKAAAGIRPTEALRLYNPVAVLRICYFGLMQIGSTTLLIHGAMEAIKYIMTSKMVMSGKTEMSITEQCSLNSYAEGMSHYLQSNRSVQCRHG